MRLLEYNNDGEFCLTKDFGDDIPRYAILSHTWGADTEEVTFKDLVDGTGKGKVGYDKIRFCGQQARRDGLQYFWVDTCCIDKSNSTELAKAINSMFRWYRNAAKCYVYLSDVSTTKRKASDQSSEFTWKSAFQESRWFTRGWTLQELLAPVTVEFFSQEQERLGDKRSLRQQIHEITGITDSALQGMPLSRFSVNERFSWTYRRQTKLEEDKAYSLLGIFDISMPLIYGEGSDDAFRRLREEIEKRKRREEQREEIKKSERRYDYIDEAQYSFTNLSYRFQVFIHISIVLLFVCLDLHLEIFTILKRIFSLERIIWIIERLFNILIRHMKACATISVTWVAYMCIFRGAIPSDYSKVLKCSLLLVVVSVLMDFGRGIF
jgi:hypothetical protein